MHGLYIIWDDKNNLGIDIIDEQHRAIVSTVNSYHYYLANGKVDLALKPILITLNQYTKIHFMTEEDLLEVTEYPDRKEHQQHHQKLSQRMVEIAKASIQEKDYYVVLQFLKKWWLNHIRIEDFKYASHVKKNRTKGIS